MSSLLCERGHRAQEAGACRTVMAHGVECRLPLAAPPVLDWCKCNEGIYVDGYCSYCGDPQAPHGEDFRCALCGKWFETLEEWQFHTYGVDAGSHGVLPDPGCSQRLPKPPEIDTERPILASLRERRSKRDRMRKYRAKQKGIQ